MSLGGVTIALLLYFYLFFKICFIFSLGPQVQHMEVPRLEIESELQFLAYTTAIATQDQSRLYELHHSLQQYRILNPLSEARDPTCINIDTSCFPFC